MLNNKNNSQVLKIFSSNNISKDSSILYIVSKIDENLNN